MKWTGLLLAAAIAMLSACAVLGTSQLALMASGPLVALLKTADGTEIVAGA